MSLAISVNKGAISLCSCSCWLCCLRGFRTEKNGTRPRELHQRKGLQWAKTLASSQRWKSTEINNLKCFVFLISSNLLMFNKCFVMFFLSTKTPIYPGSSLIIFLEQSLRAIGETVSWAKVLHKFHRIKIILNLKAVCIFFFSEDTWIYQLMT